MFNKAIHAVRSHELKAYIIYVKPPSQDRLKETRQDSYITTNYYINRPFKVTPPLPPDRILDYASGKTSAFVNSGRHQILKR